jgi:hypothetical protein
MARPITWDDDLPLDHHLEEVLGAFTAAAQYGRQAPPDALA